MLHIGFKHRLLKVKYHPVQLLQQIFMMLRNTFILSQAQHFLYQFQIKGPHMTNLGLNWAFIVIHFMLIMCCNSWTGLKVHLCSLCT